MTDNKIIYACYGSNLLRERFLVYINGGKYNNKNYKGCRDKTVPIDRGWIYIPHRLYFAKNSKTWENKGVAFISCEKESNHNFYTIVRLWEIKREQFDDIHEQEGKVWYNKILELGEIKGIKILTITGNWGKEKNPPSEKYLNVIKGGLKEILPWNNEKIEKYLEKFK